VLTLEPRAELVLQVLSLDLQGTMLPESNQAIREATGSRRRRKY